MEKLLNFFNFDNVGGKIKNLAKRSCLLTILLIWISAPIAFFVLILDDWTAEFCWIPLVSAIFGPIAVWIESWMLYAFGEFVEDVHALRNKECPIGDEQEQTVVLSSNQTSMQYNKKPNPVLSDIELSKVHQCDCGELFKGLYCPICGKKAISANSSTSYSQSEVVNPKQNSLSHLCKCGFRYYGEVCPNCGRTINDL